MREMPLVAATPVGLFVIEQWNRVDSESAAVWFTPAVVLVPNVQSRAVRRLCAPMLMPLPQLVDCTLWSDAIRITPELLSLTPSAVQLRMTTLRMNSRCAPETAVGTQAIPFELKSEMTVSST